MALFIVASSSSVRHLLSLVKVVLVVFVLLLLFISQSPVVLGLISSVILDVFLQVLDSDLLDVYSIV